MNKRSRILMCVVKAFVVLGVLPGNMALAQSPDILAFGEMGHLTWINSNTSLFYEVQWAPSLTGTGTWQSGYSALVDVQSSNATVTVSVPMFYRVSGSTNRTHFAAPVAKTGQTISYRAGDDGDLRAGVAWPISRFTVQADTNVVLDNLSGLIWARNANVVGIKTNWGSAIDYCNNLNYGGFADWRMPSRGEILSLVDNGQANSPLASGHPFVNIQPEFYWSSTTCASETNNAWILWLGDPAGTVSRTSKLLQYSVWPVRGGQ